MLVLLGVKVVWVGERTGEGTGIRVSVRMTSLLFLLGEERDRQPRAANKFWAPCRLCCVKIFFTVNDGHWFRHPRGTLLVLEAITPALWVFVHFCAAWTTTYSLSVSLVVMVSQDDLTVYGPRFWQLFFSSRPLAQLRGVFWEIPSGNVPVFSAIWFDSGYMFVS